MEKIPSPIAENLLRAGVVRYTEIQEKVIPLALSGVNVIGLSATGSGKTIAYLAPVLTKLIHHPHSAALVVLPTRELAQQVAKIATELLRDTGLSKVLLIGGTSLSADERALRRRPSIVIGTPGRIYHHLDKISDLHVNTLILDEVDELLTHGFKKEYDVFTARFSAAQKLYFSSTLPESFRADLGRGGVHWEEVNLTTGTPKHTITQSFEMVQNHREKVTKLLALVKEVSHAVIFVNTKRASEQVDRILKDHGHTSTWFNSNLTSNRRARIHEKFMRGQIHYLVATDVAARGIDFKELPLVINYDVPPLANTYVHRVGRTGRHQHQGRAVTLVTPREQKYLRHLESFRQDNRLIQEPRPSRTAWPRTAGRAPFRKGSYPRPRHFTGGARYKPSRRDPGYSHKI